MSSHKKVKIKRFDAELPLPIYKTKGAAGFDLFAREDVTIKPRTFGYVPLNVAVDTPKDHFFLLAARSSTHKLGLMPANGIGIGDPDFVGDEDEYKIILYNFTAKPIKVERGMRVAQGMFVKFVKAKWHEVKKLNNKSRGGLGSTGNK